MNRFDHSMSPSVRGNRNIQHYLHARSAVDLHQIQIDDEKSLHGQDTFEKLVLRRHRLVETMAVLTPNCGAGANGDLRARRCMRQGEVRRSLARSM